MSLRIIYGRAGSGKSRFCLEDIKNTLLKSKSKRLFLIVPEQYSLQAEKNLVKMVDNGGIMRADVLTFKRMAWRVFNEVGGSAATPINSIGKNMIIYNVLEKYKDNLKVYKNSAGRQGFVSSVSDLIAEFKRYSITSESLNDIYNDESNVLLKLKLQDLALIYEEYESLIHQKYIDSDDDLTNLSLKIEECESLKDSEVWIDEFHGFTPQEYKVIEKLLTVCDKVNVTLYTDCLLDECSIDNTNVFAPSHSTAYKLARAANNVKAGVDTAINLNTKSEVPYRFKESSEIAHLEKYFFVYPPKKYNLNTTDISLLVAGNYYLEVERTAINIISLIRDEGLRFRDIAVVTRNLDIYAKLVQAVFPQFGIPFFIDMKRDISTNPIIVLINSVINIFLESYSYDAVFSYVKTGLSNVSIIDANLLENYVLEWGIKGKTWIREEPWDFASRSLEYEKYSNEIDGEGNIDNIRRALVSPLIQLRSVLRGKKTAKEFCTALYNFLNEIYVPDKIDALVEDFRANNLLSLAEEYEQVWNQFIGVLDQVVEVLKEDTISVETFSELLQVGFSECNTGIIPPSVDEVLIGSVERSKSHEIKALFILGANDGIFPMVSNEEGILSDRDRESLQQKGIELAADTKTRAFEEQFLVYTALTTPSKKLCMSYSIADSESKTLRPSILVSKLKRLFPNMIEYSNVLPSKLDIDKMRDIAAPIPTFNKMIYELQSNLDEVSVMWKDVFNWFYMSDKYKVSCLESINWLNFTNNQRGLSTDTTIKLYGQTLYSSVSRLEKFAACPFAHYIQYGLKAEERKIYKVSAPDIGSFMHEVLDKVSKELASESKNFKDLDRLSLEEKVEKASEELLTSRGYSVFTSSKRSEYLAKRLKRVMKRAVWLIAEHLKDSGFQPIGYEVQFGNEEELNFIEVELPNGQKMKLTGRIDRLDAARIGDSTYFRIIDYKSGNKDLKLQDAYYGIQIQLLTYMSAVWQQESKLLEKPIVPGGILYFKLDDPVVKNGRDLTEEDIELAIKKQLKMKGLLLADVKVIKEMDLNISGDSNYLPTRINKDGNLGRGSSATSEQFQVLGKYINSILTRLGNEILQGTVKALPYKRKKQTACDYCTYSAICQFDVSLKDNKYKLLKTMGNDDAIRCMRESGEN